MSYRQIHLSLYLCLLFSAVSAQTFVKADAVGVNDGSSWEHAYTDLQSALEDKSAVEIWVAGGIYHPGGPEPDTGSVFLIDRSGISLYGGFAGTETSLESRDPEANPTILSGDLLENDLPGEFTQNREDNVRQIIRIKDDLNESTLIDGFRIIGGHRPDLSQLGPGIGSGITAASEVRINDCKFSRHNGSAISIWGKEIADGSITGTSFANNRASILVILLEIADYTLADCTFEDNTGVGEEPVISFDAYVVQNLVLENCRFQNNGIAMILGECQQVKMRRLSFFQNAEGARIFACGSPEQPVIVDSCRFENNRKGPVLSFNRSPLSMLDSYFVLKHSDFLENEAQRGGGLHLRDAYGRIEDCLFERNLATQGWGGGLVALGGVIQMENCRFLGNHADITGGAFNGTLGASVALNHCIFLENTARFGGAGMVEEGDTHLSVDSCHFERNRAERSGGAISSSTRTWVEIDCSTFLNNEALEYFGGAIQVSEGDSDGTRLRIDRSVFWANQARSFAGAVQLLGADATFTNNLFVGNATTAFENDAGAIYSDRNSQGLDSMVLINNTFAHNDGNYRSLYIGQNFTLTWIVLQNNLFGDDGINFGKHTDFSLVRSLGGNLSTDLSFSAVFSHPTDKSAVDPQFVDSGTDPQTASFELQASSPAIDAGIKEGAPAVDIEGRPRSGAVDIGAYEYQSTVAVDRHGQTTKLQISPNPVGQRLFVHFPPDFPARRQWSIFDQTGRLVGGLPPGAQREMEVGHLPAGIYLLLIEAGGQRRSLPFVKE